MINFANINEISLIDSALQTASERLGLSLDFGEDGGVYTVSDDGKSISYHVLSKREDLFREDDAGCFSVSLEFSDERTAYLSVKLEDYLELSEEDFTDELEGMDASAPDSYDWLLMPELYYGGSAVARCKLTFSSIAELCRLITERMTAFDDPEFINEFSVRRYNHYFDEE